MDHSNDSWLITESDRSGSQPKFVGLSEHHPVLYIFVIAYVYLLAWVWPRSAKKDANASVAWSVPFLKSTVAFLFNGYRMFKNIPRQFPNYETVRIDVIRDEVYAVQGPKNVAELFRNPAVTNDKTYSLFLEQCYGMDRDAARHFVEGASTRRGRPSEDPATPQDDIFHATHKNLVDGLRNQGLPNAMENVELNFHSALQRLPFGKEWVEMPDLSTFYEHLVSTVLMETLYGRRLLQEYPTFLDDLWEFDHSIMSLLRRYPPFLFPKGYASRSRLLSGIKRWQLNGPKSYSDDEIAMAYQEDKIWGTKWMKERNDLFLASPSQTQLSTASMNLGLFWGTIVNVVPSAQALMINVLNDRDLLFRIRNLLDDVPAHPSREALNMAEVEKIPLLSSIYAETLRTIMQIHLPRVSKHSDIQLEGATIPRNKLILANMMVAHMDTKVWNTQDGKKPVEEFWAERFIVDPQDVTSGPVRRDIRKNIPHESEKPYFSTRGLEGSFIPFGGGRFVCPGQTIARRVMLTALSMIITQFDIELATNGPVEFHSPRFGLSVKMPKGPVPFRIRRRAK